MEGTPGEAPGSENRPPISRRPLRHLAGTRIVRLCPGEHVGRLRSRIETHRRQSTRVTLRRCRRTRWNRN
jgi:hypothetical protein